MIPCKEIVKLLNTEEKIPLLTRAEIKMHIFMCKHCAAYATHLKLLKRGFSVLFRKITSIETDAASKVETDVIKKVQTLKNKGRE